MTWSVAINGTAIEDKRLVMVEGGPPVSGLNHDRAYQPMPGRAGGLLAADATVGARVFRFGLFTSPSFVSTSLLRHALLDELRDLFQGAVELTFNTGIARKITGVCTVFEGSVMSPTFVNIPVTIVVEIVCENAAFVDVEPTQLVLGSTPVRVNVGTLPQAGRLYVTGPNTTSFTITYRDIAGVQRGQLAITPDLATGERLIIDLLTRQIAKVDSSDQRILVPDWDTGSTWFHVDPSHCNRELGLMPTLETSVSTLYEFRRNWEH